MLKVVSTHLHTAMFVENIKSGSISLNTQCGATLHV